MASHFDSHTPRDWGTNNSFKLPTATWQRVRLIFTPSSLRSLITAASSPYFIQSYIDPSLFCGSIEMSDLIFFYQGIKQVSGNIIKIIFPYTVDYPNIWHLSLSPQKLISNCFPLSLSFLQNRSPPLGLPPP